MTSFSTFDKLASEAAELGERTIIMPIDEIRLSAALAALPDQDKVVTRLISELFNHHNMHVRRIGVNAARRSKAFHTWGLKEALTARLSDPEAWVQYDAAWAIAEAGFDSPEIRERLAGIAGNVTIPEGEARVRADLGNSKLQAQLRAKKTLDSILTARH
jgi:hypothetical protein